MKPLSFRIGLFLLLITRSLPSVAQAPISAPSVRFEVLPVDGGAELLTLFFTENPESAENTDAEVPLISVLRDTLGSSDAGVHQLRYVWLHTAASPALKQRFAAATPFVYSRFGNTGTSKVQPPSPAMDISAPDDRLWRRVWELALKGALFDPRVSLLESAVRTYGGNRSLYLQAQFSRASTAIDMDDDSNLPVLSDVERRQLQQGFARRSKGLAPLLNDAQLERFYQKEMVEMRQACARNWELLRQRAESEGLYFEPLLLPDGTATHALLWVARADVEGKRQAAFNDRFLSIKKPWGDKALLNWKGATEVRYYDAENRRLLSAEGAAREVEFIPLALYGLDHPKIPVLLIDFRDPLNAKGRELSRQVIIEAGRVATGSNFVNLAIKMGRLAAGAATQRMGVDLFQPSRLLSYSQLKMVLSANPGVGSDMRAEIGRRVEHVAMNPLENDMTTEVKLARSQYEALVEYSRRSDGLRADLDRDRRAELTTTAHGAGSKFMFRLGGIVTFGLYRHREKGMPEMDSVLEAQRRNIKQLRFLEDVAKSGPYIDVRWDQKKVRNALSDVFATASMPDDALADTAFRIFDNSVDDETRHLCLATLYQLDTDLARKKLLLIAQDQRLDEKWRALSAVYLDGGLGDPRLADNPFNRPSQLPTGAND
jgi:hypothetical protein